MDLDPLLRMREQRLERGQIQIAVLVDGSGDGSRMFAWLGIALIDTGASDNGVASSK